MTQEDKELLLKDISGRLPYGLIVQISLFRNDGRKRDLDLDPHVTENIWELIDKYHALPYLRPMSSMTEEEDNEWSGLNVDPLLEAVGERHTRAEDLMLRAKSQYQPTEWLNAHHFDYRGLIPMGLAIEVTPENNPYNDVKD